MILPSRAHHRDEQGMLSPGAGSRCPRATVGLVRQLHLHGESCLRAACLWSRRHVPPSQEGLTVHLDVVEDPTCAASRLPRGIGLAIYRTVQEALTNVRRHSTADAVSVVVRVDESTSYAEVEVVDNGRPRHGTSGSGLGQLGIRERAATHDGQVDIGPRVTGGYRVRVRYPLGATA